MVKVKAKPRLRTERIMHGLSQEDFAKLLGYSNASAYGKIELAKNGPRPQKVVAICERLGLEFDDLFEFYEYDE